MLTTSNSPHNTDSTAGDAIKFMSEILVLCTADTPDLAQRIGSMLVESSLAACVSILPGIRSIYRWQGKICNEGEVLLLIKSTAGRFEEICASIRGIHSYQVPEIIAVPITAGDADYLNWLRQNAAPESS
jgi:periplasmic divalent cation tolerance protein